ncbi:unnamed protein product [Victoria cruziana]
MDLKSSKKGKGASYQQQHHQHAGRKPESNKPTKKKTHQNRHPSQAIPTQPTLPSNWGRYEEEGDEVGENDPESTSSRAAKQEVVVPKSKGADYAYLISEAQSQSHGVPFFHEDLLQDFSLGISSMLSARGRGFTSLAADDNFHVDDSPLDHEASFFSLDFHLLAAKLAKLEPSKRLFVEDDKLPASMRASAFKASTNEDSETVERSLAGESKNGQQPLVVDICSSEDIHLHNTEQMHRDSQENEVVLHNRYDLTHKSVEGQDVADNPACVRPNDSNQIKSTFRAKDDASSAREEQYDASKTIQKMPTSRFDATSAEAELDTLLDSFGEANLLDSFDIKQKFPSKSVGAPAPSHSRESSSLASSGSTYKVPNQLPLINEGPDKKMLPGVASSTANDKGKGGKSENASLVSLDDFDEWLDSI